ncbi:MAG: LLM class F420-dependent oxidoreductase [Myxococcales bacterium]
MTALRPRLGLTVPMVPSQPPVAQHAVALAKEMCAKGYDELWLAEVNAAECYALAGALSQAAPGVRIGMGVLPLATRSVMIHALGSYTLSELTGGRFSLGLGISSENIVRDWAGQPYDKPIPRMREALGALRKAFAGEKVQVAGETLSMKNFRLPSKVEVPLFVGALNPQMLRLAGALADGVVLNMVPESALKQVLGEVRRGAEEAGRDPASLEVVARLHVSVLPSIDHGREVVRMAFGPYVAVGGYNRFFQWIGMEQEALAVKEAFSKGDRAGVAKAMTPRLCDAIGIAGDEAHVRARIRAYAEQGVDVCVLNPLAAGAAAQKAVFEQLSDVLAGISFAERGVMRATR